MKRGTIWGLAITLVLGCWAGSASAALLDPEEALLVPYYEVSGNLATLIGVQHVVDPPAGAFSVINVAVYGGDDGALEARSDICLGEDEFGFVVLQSAQPTARDTAKGIYFSKAEDSISDRGFVTLAYGGSTSDCALTGNVAIDHAPDEKKVMVAWAIMQDISSGFFATEIPITEGVWAASVDLFAERPAKGLQRATCYNFDTSTETPTDVNSAGNGCTTDGNTFLSAGHAYCYLNTDPARAAVYAELKTTQNGCSNPFTHTFVPRGRKLPKIEAVAAAPGVSLDCSGDCPGLAVAADPSPTIGARFDVESSNRSVSNIYLWLDTAPLDGRDVKSSDFNIVCEDGTTPELTPSQLKRIDIDGKVSVINPAGLGCSGRGVLNLTLPRRTAVDDFCHVSTDTDRTAVPAAFGAVEDRNNKCKTFAFTRDIAGDGSNTPGCYETGVSPRATTSVSEAENPGSGTVTSCHRFTYVADVTADTPDGFIFSHIKQSNDHFRMNFPGYEK
jgi:hypothetical protein